VAEEVRKLAEESGSAAQEVERRIGDLVRNTREASGGVQKAVSTLGETIAGAERAIGRLDVALEEIGRVDEAMHALAASAEEQAASSEEMAEGIDGITRRTGETASEAGLVRKSLEETFSVAREVEEEAARVSRAGESLEEVLGRFRLDGEVRALQG